ncbi:ArsR family transcriptional regulator [Halorussus limi]|uniref:ArsR family transcriptional regulator n=1 Tax=Halorussus limi TaxID=2938695 RepID=A0A8U0HY21_9EURY|nr:ArsR family transcriptional regulator [Halorussus limi]UPV75807.1 ArsR family transcriptional regulator [Halorussus limi]
MADSTTTAGGADAVDADARDATETRRQLLHVATEDVAHQLLIDVAGHPEGAPSEKELNWTNPDVSRRTVGRRLDDLVDVGVLEKLTYEPGEQPEDADSNVRTFYRFTDRARDLFDEVGMFDPGVWRPVYARVEKPDDVRAAQAVPRP